jgi:hypothetical protein
MKEYSALITDSDFEVLCGLQRGQGTARFGFDVPSDPDVFIKRSRAGNPGSNKREWGIWKDLVGGPFEPIFARCIAISDTGLHLMMERGNDISKADYADIPDVPIWLNDCKPDAFGWVGGRIKCRDYGVINTENYPSTELRKIAFVVNARFARDWRK